MIFYSYALLIVYLVVTAFFIGAHFGSDDEVDPGIVCRVLAVTTGCLLPFVPFIGRTLGWF